MRSACKSSHAVDFCLVFPIRGGLSRKILDSKGHLLRRAAVQCQLWSAVRRCSIRSLPPRQMWYPLGKPQAPGVWHVLEGAYGQNKVCKQRARPGDQGWHRGSCASAGYEQQVTGTLNAPEFVKRGQVMPHGVLY